jgi:polyisoprenoid-binding protein YceI
MKKLYIIFLVLFTACTQAPKSDKAETTEAKDVNTGSDDSDNWTVDPAASEVKWIGTKVSGYHVGSISIKDGKVKVRDGQVTGGKITLDMKSLAVTGPKGSNEGANNKLLGHLKTADFFDVEKYPEASFEITEVQPFSGTVNDADDPRQEEISKYKVSDPTHTVSGNLTMKNITKNITFPARITISGDQAAAQAKFNIDRKLWDLTYAGKPDDLIRDEVHIGISLKAHR